MSQSRMRMRPWLESQINSKEIPGLQWINKEEKLFQVPWKHAAKHGWDIKKDAYLFKNWAIHTGRYKEGDVQPDPKTWKANFRCAMNSLPDIEEVKDKSISKGCSAVRVYRMLEASTKSKKNEKKSKSSKNKSLKKPVEDIKAEETAEATSSIQLSGDHNGYSLPSYISEEMEVGDICTLQLSTYGLEDNPEWRDQLPDSTNNKYQIQVSPIASDDEDSCLPELYLPSFHDSNWHSTNIGEKGYLINEPGKPSFFESVLQEPDRIFNIDISQIDSRPSTESLLDSLQLPIAGSIPCGI